MTSTEGFLRDLRILRSFMEGALKFTVDELDVSSARKAIRLTLDKIDSISGKYIVESDGTIHGIE